MIVREFRTGGAEREERRRRKKEEEDAERRRKRERSSERRRGISVRNLGLWFLCFLFVQWGVGGWGMHDTRVASRGRALACMPFGICEFHNCEGASHGEEQWVAQLPPPAPHRPSGLPGSGLRAGTGAQIKQRFCPAPAARACMWPEPWRLLLDILNSNVECLPNLENRSCSSSISKQFPEWPNCKKYRTRREWGGVTSHVFVHRTNALRLI
jgi:hypothetical protein